MKIKDELKWIRKHGLKAWLTWATIEEATDRAPLRRSAQFWRWVLR